MAVRLSDGRTLARKADRGATSILWVHERRMRNIKASGSEDGIGIIARHTADGRCVKAMVCITVSSCLYVRTNEKGTYLDIANPLCDGGSDQHRCCRNDARSEEDRTQLSFGNVELLLEEVGDP